MDAEPGGVKRLLCRATDDSCLACVPDDGREGQSILVDDVDRSVAGYHRDEAVGGSEVEAYRHQAPPSSALSCCNSLVSPSMTRSRYSSVTEVLLFRSACKPSDSKSVCRLS